MHYYKRHIGDYAKKAGHLSPLEHGVYNLIIDSYYDREQAPTLLEAMRWARARTEEEKSAVLAVLDEFFVLEDERYQQNRIEEELAIYHGKAEVNRKIAIAREQAKKDRREHDRGTTDRRTVARSEHESCTNGGPETHELSTSGQPNHKPLTTNQEPREKVKTTVPPDGETSVVRSQVKTVFSYWQTKRGHDRAKLDDKRSKAIRARLKDGYSAEDLCRAVDGIAKSAHHMGQNDSRTVYDDIELICRTAANVDKFAKLASPAAVVNPGLQRQIDVLKEWMEQE
jgi:uncharacterized protein YdaU (DUF1376 family)